MAKRKAEAEEQFFRCAGIGGVADTALRKVIAKLNGQDTMRAAAERPSFQARFRRWQDALLQDEETGIFTCNLQVYVDKLCEHDNLAQVFRQHLLAARQSDAGLLSCIYADEAVPGNVLSPDNRRKAWLFYFSWLPLIKFRSEFWWIPLALVRSERYACYAVCMPLWRARCVQVTWPVWPRC